MQTSPAGARSRRNGPERAIDNLLFVKVINVLTPRAYWGAVLRGCGIWTKGKAIQRFAVGLGKWIKILLNKSIG